jgi:hypothetical protein
LYVDDIVVTSNEQENIKDIKYRLFSHFETKYCYFLQKICP